MENRKKQFITTFVIGAVLLTGIVILVNMVVDNFNPGRVDLTADQVYKISPSVGKILSELEAPIEITYYVSSSEKMPTQWKNLERDVIDKLKELKLASKGMLSFTVFDPSAEEEKEAFEESRAEEKEEGLMTGQKKSKVTRKKIAQQLFEKGVIPFGVQSTERDEFAVKRVYSSIVLSYLDRKEDVIEEVRPETFGSLEYEIMSRIYKLISNRKPKIGFYPSQPETPPQYRQYYNQTPPDMYESAVELLKQSGYDVTRTNIKKDDPIPEDIQTMIVMMDQPLNERQLYEIDKLVHKGVRLIIGGQQFNFQISSMNQPGQFQLMGMPTQLNINELTKQYGFEIENKIFMDKSAAYIQIPVYQTRNMGMFQLREQRYEPVTKPVIIRVNPENINTELSISNKISNIFYLYGNRVLILDDVIKENNLHVQTLFTSSNYSWVKQGPGYGPVDDTPPTSDQILRRQPFGIILEGKFKPKFVDVDIPKWPVEPGEEDENAEEKTIPSDIVGNPAENKIIAFGCSNLFKSDVIQSVPSHAALLQNCVDALTLGDELINIRSKNIAARRIREISSVGKAAAKTFVIWFSPLVFVAAGIYLTIRRKVK